MKFHSPSNPPIEKHHYPPTAYPLKAGGVRLLIPMCASAHGIQHRVLNAMKGMEPGVYPRGTSAYHKTLADYTWANTDISKPIPRTLASGNTLPGDDTLA